MTDSALTKAIDWFLNDTDLGDYLHTPTRTNLSVWFTVSQGFTYEDQHFGAGSTFYIRQSKLLSLYTDNSQ